MINGPKGSWLTGNLSQFGQDPLAFLEECAKRGDMVQIHFLKKSVVILNDPAHIEQVMSSNAKNFRKTLGYRTPFMKRLFGEGLLTSEGEFWMRQRKMSQPAFHRDRIASYAKVITGFADEMKRGWKPGETRDIHEEMLRLTTKVVTKTLFNAEVPPEINDLSRSTEAVMNRFTKQWSLFRIFLSFLPTPSSRRFEKVMNQLDDYIYGLIRERRASGKDMGDLLSMLLATRDDDGSGMNDRQLRDELTTLMVAGLDTTALTLSWGWYLLSQHPEVERQLHQEVTAVLGGRTAVFEDLPKLAYTEMVIKETMRLYPPGWVMGREAIYRCEIDGESIAPGTSLIVSQWLKHRDPRYFSEPLKFIPERWKGDEAKKLPKYAYFPFGGGPRICIGSGLAMMEAILAMATVAQSFRLTAPGWI